MNGNDGFLDRWSKRKLGGDDAEQDTPETPDKATLAAREDVAAADATDKPGADVQPSAGGEPAAPADEGAKTAEGEPAPWENVDIDALDANSDYTVFMGAGVPEDIKKQALDKLWRSDPVFANLDGLNDYDLDYSKWGIVDMVVKTAWKIGQGFQTDEELAETDARIAREKAEAEGRLVAENDEVEGEADDAEDAPEIAGNADAEGADEAPGEHDEPQSAERPGDDASAKRLAQATPAAASDDVGGVDGEATNDGDTDADDLGTAEG